MSSEAPESDPGDDAPPTYDEATGGIQPLPRKVGTIFNNLSLLSGLSRGGNFIQSVQELGTQHEDEEDANTQIFQSEHLSQEESILNCFQQPTHFYSKPIHAMCPRCNRIVLTTVEKVPGKWALCAGLTCFCFW